MQTFKINQYNFLMEDLINNELMISNIDLNLKLNFFYIDGKEDTLFVNYNIDNTEFGIEIHKKFSQVINYIQSINQQLNSLLDKKVDEMLKYGEYSRYDLYSDFSIAELRDILNEEKSNYKLSYYDTSFRLNLKDNLLISGNNIEYNPNTNKVENFEKLYENGYFNTIINNKLRRREYERNIAPNFVYELTKVYYFLENKKTVNIKLKDCENFKADANLSYILEKRYNGNDYKLINSSHNIESFERSNPGKSFLDIKIDDLEALSYGRNESITISPNNLKNLCNQIAITNKDKLKFKLEFLKQELYSQFYNYIQKMGDELPYISSIYELDRIFRYKDYYENEWDRIPKKEIRNLVDFHRKSILIDSLIKEMNFRDLKELINLTKDDELVSLEKKLKIELEKLQEIYDSKINDNERKILDCINNVDFMEMAGINNYKFIIEQVEIAQNEFYKIEKDIENANQNNISWETLYNKYNGYWKKIYENGEVQFGAYSKPIEFTIKQDINGVIKINSKDINIFADDITSSNLENELFNRDFTQNIDFDKIRRVAIRSLNNEKNNMEELKV